MVFETPPSARFMIIEVEACPVGDGVVGEFGLISILLVGRRRGSRKALRALSRPGSFIPQTDVEEMRYYASLTTLLKVEDLWHASPAI